MRIRNITIFFIVCLGLFCTLMSDGLANEWKLVKQLDDNEKIYVKMMKKVNDHQQIVLGKRVCLNPDKCSVDIMNNFCKVWTCSGDYVGDKDSKIPAQYDISRYLIDCKNKRYKKEDVKWYAKDDALIGGLDIQKPGWTSFKPSSDDKNKLSFELIMGEIDLFEFVCKKP